MLTNIHHVSYLVPNLGAAIHHHVAMFRGEQTGRGTVAGLGRVGFAQAGNLEMQFIEPEDKGQLSPSEGYTVHPVACLVDDLDGAVADFSARGYTFATTEPFTNFIPTSVGTGLFTSTQPAPTAPGFIYPDAPIATGVEP